MVTRLFGYHGLETPPAKLRQRYPIVLGDDLCSPVEILVYGYLGSDHVIMLASVDNMRNATGSASSSVGHKHNRAQCRASASLEILMLWTTRLVEVPNHQRQPTKRSNQALRRRWRILHSAKECLAIGTTKNHPLVFLNNLTWHET